MFDLAKRLRTLDVAPTTDTTPSAIFGSASTLGRGLDIRPAVRIAMWPCMSAEKPVAAVGLMSALALLLERWSAVRVYRLLVQLDGEAEAFVWTAAKSQFGPDDWKLPGLDSNVAIWGKLEHLDTGEYQLELELQDERDSDIDENIILEYKVASLSALVNSLPTVVVDILEELDASSELASFDLAASTEEDRVIRLLERLAGWNVELLQHLWGKEYPEDRLQEDIAALIGAGRANESFGAWSVASALAYGMQPGFGETSGLIADMGLDKIEDFGGAAEAITVFSRALHRRGLVDDAIGLLEDLLESTDGHPVSWITLADMYRLGARNRDAVDTFQRAIEKNAVNVPLYVRYANLLVNLRFDGDALEEFILIDPDDYDDNYVTYEAIAAHDEALKETPDSPPVLAQQLVWLAGVGEMDRFWEGFKRLIDIDGEGNRVQNVLDVLYEVEDPDPAVEYLRDAVNMHPDRIDLVINLATAQIVAEDYDEAGDTLDRALDMTDDPADVAHINLLLLTVDDPEFETRLSDMREIIGAGNALSSADVEYLEDIIERAPSLNDAYEVLARAYLIWDEQEDALDVLLDGFEHAAEKVEIIDLLARTLWETDERALALDYLNKGLASYPNAIPLLALAGRYWFEEGDVDEFREKMARAEALSPRHPALEEARREISRMIGRVDRET